MARRAYAYNVTIYVGGQPLSNPGASVSGGGGTATLAYDDNDNPVLTLNNYTYSGTGHSGAAIYYVYSSPLTIVLVGNNSVTHEADSGDTSAGILIANDTDLTIAGTGSLTVAGGNTNGKSYGVGSAGSAGGNITISGGTVSATSGSAQYCAGIVGAGGVVISNAKVEATGGTTSGDLCSSAGIAVYGNGVSIFNSKVIATGGSAAGSRSGNSYGIRCASASEGVTISGESAVTASGGESTVTASGGESKTADSSGLWADSVAISGSSSVNATGGKAQSSSHGIYGRDSVTISDEANVEASGSADGVDTYGISCGNGSISIDGGEVTAAGNNKACDGTVKNAILGKGWTDAEGKQGKAAIEVSAEGQTLAFKRVQFPANMATVTKAPEPKDLTYTGSAQDLVTAGNAKDGTIQYSLNGETWSGAIPTGTNAGEYAVWYKAVGDGEYLDSEAQKLTVAIKEKAEPAPAPDAVALAGSGHVQNVGDVAGRASGAGVKVGTEGRSLRLEQFSVSLPKDVQGGIEYRGHLQNSGWGGWVDGGGQCGTRGEGLRVEAVQMRLSGALGKTHSVWYRVHAQNFGTLGWARDGQAAGTAGQGLRLESIEARVLPRGEVPAGYAEGQASYVGAVGGSAHVQNAGWAGARTALEFGTTGQGRRLEAVRLSAPATPVPAGISYEAHVQNVGWQGARTAGQLAGTTGRSLRIEAVRISLTGEAAAKGNYSVWYRVHSQDYGWLGWAHDGAEAGTSGLGRRAEAIDVQVLPQGQVPRGYDASRAACVTR